MIFLIGKIFIYLLLAGVVGAAAGWLFRNLQAQRTEERAQRAAHDAKAKLPQLESLLRGRDEQIGKLKDRLAEKKEELAQQTQDLREMEQRLRDQERETRRWQENAEAHQHTGMDDFAADADADADAGADANGLIAELSQEISRLKEQLAAREAAPDIAPVADTSAADGEALEALRTRLAEAEKALALAKADLEHEQTKVLELERERELQNRSLQVLHQQLDLERTRRVANG